MDQTHIVISVPGSNRIFCRDHFQIRVIARSELLQALKAMFGPMPDSYAWASTTITGWCRYDSLGNAQVEVASIYHSVDDTPASWQQQLELFMGYVEGMVVVTVDIQPPGLDLTTTLFMLGEVLPSHD